MEFEVLEADFQQYYGIDLIKMLRNGGFSRFCRLAINLPQQSRFYVKLYPEVQWTWQEELLSNIFMAITNFNVDYHNANRAKGNPAVKRIEKPFRPNYDKPEHEKDLEKERRKQQVKKAKEFWKL